MRAKALPVGSPAQGGGLNRALQIRAKKMSRCRPEFRDREDPVGPTAAASRGEAQHAPAKELADELPIGDRAS
eukprot:6449053-Pyramimonas_sp.AAC.1